MNKTAWIRLERWYTGLHCIQRWLVIIGLGLFLLCCILVVTHEPRERPRQTKIILDCYEGCGVNLERTISYNAYIDQKEQTEKIRVKNEQQRIRQEIWDDRGRQRWCRNNPQDRNCK
jgi:hypothetical protein